MHISTLRAFWEKTAEKFGRNGYKAVCTPTSMGVVNWYTNILQTTALSSVLDDCRGFTVLDVGCGVGRWILKLGQIGANTIGIDISRKMVIEARRRLRLKGNRKAELIVASATNLPFKESYFDVCLSVTCLQHVIEEVDLKRSVGELLRVVRNGGRLILLEASPSKPQLTCRDFPTAFRATSEWLASLLDKNTRLERLRGVDLSLLKRLLDKLVKRLAKDNSFYRQQLFEEEHVLSAKFKLLKAIQSIVMNVAIILSLPLDLILRDFLKESTFHKLFVLRKISSEPRSRVNSSAFWWKMMNISTKLWRERGD